MEINDLAFGYHAVLLTVVTIVQCVLYRTQRQRVHPIHAFIVACLWLLTLYTLILCFASSVPLLPHCSSPTSSQDASFTLIDFMGYVKAFISIIKYTPQAYLNYRRQSTVGWSITNILLDFTGGSLSFAQQVVDSINAGSTYPLFGNVPKLLLALESVAFDVLFMVQHYVLYRGRGVKGEEEGEEPLVDGEGEGGGEDGGAETDEGEEGEKGQREGEAEDEQVEGAERRGRAAPKKKPQSLGSRKLSGGAAPANGGGVGGGGGRGGKQKRPLRLLEDGGGGGVDADGLSSPDLHYHPPEVVDDDADDPYQPGFSSPAGRINQGGGMSSFGRVGGGGGAAAGLRVARMGAGGGGTPRLAIVDRYGDSGVSGGRR